jgi:CRP-like cAMP-binding protein
MPTFESNAILASLSAGDESSIRPHLKALHLPQKTVLYEAGDTIRSVYFPLSAVISLVITLETGETTEAAMVGKDGAVGIVSALDGKIALSRAITQLAGDALVCDPTTFKSIAMQSERLISLVMRHEQTLLRKRNNPPLAWQTTKSKRVFAAGCCGRAICSAAMIYLSPRNFWPKCLACGERA